MTTISALALVYPSLLTFLVPSQNHTIFANDDGFAYVIDISEYSMNETEVTELANATMMTSFFLYTRNNPKVGQELYIDDLDSVSNSYWDPKHPTRFVTHGWQGNIDKVTCTLIRDAYLKSGDYNVILVDWRQAASYYRYWISVESVPKVAIRMALMLDFLRKHADLNPMTTKLIGHSLGAHASSLAARFAIDKIGEVAALDPARPLFTEKKPGERMDKTDAILVQVIHTNAGYLGMQEAIGTADFYPNGGTSQPGCIFDWIGTCAHSRSYMYYAESVLNPKGFRADDVFMGGPFLDPHAKGEYILKTNSKSPFALG